MDFHSLVSGQEKRTSENRVDNTLDVMVYVQMLVNTASFTTWVNVSNQETFSEQNQLTYNGQTGSHLVRRSWCCPISQSFQCTWCLSRNKTGMQGVHNSPLSVKMPDCLLAWNTDFKDSPQITKSFSVKRNNDFWFLSSSKPQTGCIYPLFDWNVIRDQRLRLKFWFVLKLSIVYCLFHSYRFQLWPSERTTVRVVSRSEARSWSGLISSFLLTVSPHTPCRLGPWILRSRASSHCATWNCCRYLIWDYFTLSFQLCYSYCSEGVKYHSRVMFCSLRTITDIFQASKIGILQRC